MAIVSFWETGLRRGSFPGATSWSAEHNFPAPGVQVWSRPYLQSASMGDDSSVMLTVSDFTDEKGFHPGPFSPGIVSGKHCTQVKFTMFTEDCVCAAAFTSEILG